MTGFKGLGFRVQGLGLQPHEGYVMKANKIEPNNGLWFGGSCLGSMRHLHQRIQTPARCRPGPQIPQALFRHKAATELIGI